MKIPDSWRARPPGFHGAVRVNLRQIALDTLILGLLFAALLAVPFFLYHRAESENKRELLQKEQERVVQLAAGLIRQEMESALSDLRYLTQHNELKLYLARQDSASRLDLAQEYAVMAGQKHSYSRIRFLGLDGNEEVRVNADAGEPEIVAAAALQDKHGRYYFEEALWLSPGQIYVSPLDLNVEGGEVEQPPNPVVRFIAPVADAQGLIRGMVILNYRGDRLREKLRALEGEVGRIWLMNGQGDWLLGPEPEDEWSFMFPQRPPRSAAVQLPQLWERIQAQSSGVYRSAGSTVLFETIHPLQDVAADSAGRGFADPVDAGRYRWIVAVELSREAIQAASAGLLQRLQTVYGALALFGFVVAGLLAYARNRTRILAGGAQQILDSVPLLVSYVDREQRYRFNNLAYQRWFGTDPRDICGKRLPDLLGETAYRDIEPYVEQALAGEAVAFERQIPYQDAGLRDVVVDYLPDVSPEGEVRGFYALVSDVTLVKDAERRERQRMAELAHVSRLASMGEMASEIAHEINQPLAAIALYSSAGLRTLQQPGHEQGQIEAWLEAINAQAKRASEIIRRLRRFLQKGETQQGPVDMNQVAREAAALLAHDAKAQQVAVVLDLTDALPRVQGDRVLLQQVVFNLGRNAVDALHDQPGERIVTLATEFDAGQVTLKVSDNGPGVDPRLGEAIFDSFISGKKEGLGLGLTISRSIVEAHAGTLRYVANPQGGATFMFSLERESF